MDRLAIAVLGGLFAGAAQADFNSMIFANELGTILGSERACGLSYNQDAVQRLIDDRVDPSNLGFASELSTMIMGSEYMANDWSGSAKAAQCRAVENTAREYGFID